MLRGHAHSDQTVNTIATTTKQGIEIPLLSMEIDHNKITATENTSRSDIQGQEDPSKQKKRF